MIKIENAEVVGWEHAIRGMRNPKNSWGKRDSVYGTYWGEIDGHKCFDNSGFIIGPNDYKLMMSLAKSGPVYAKYRRMITVYADITAPLYWWKEYDTYKVGTVANSCSTMHKIHSKEFSIEDFSCEHLATRSMSHLRDTIDILNDYRNDFINYRDGDNYIENDGQVIDRKDIWYQMIQLLPSSYNQKRTVMLNYEVLAGIYPMRKDHKIDEWHGFCHWIESLPYSEIITGNTSEA